MTQMHSDVKTANRVSVVTMVGNILLSAFKMAAGIFAHSGAMVSDAIHSISDVCSTVVVLFGVNLGRRAADKKHPYGHEKLESAASALLAVMLAATALGVGWSGVRGLLTWRENPAAPDALALIAAVVSILVKEWMYWYTRAAAVKIRSGALKADAWHHRSDALSSVGSLIGIGGAMLGFPFLEPAASLVIALMILQAAVSILRSAFSELVDEAADDDFQGRLHREAEQVPGVVRIDSALTRLHGNRMYVDLEIAVPGALPLREAHAVADLVHDRIEAAFPVVKHCMVHVNPAEPEEKT